jgi:hypothetical protein
VKFITGGKKINKKIETLMSLNTESGFYVRKGCLHNISGEFHYTDLHPKFKKEKKKAVAKKLEWFVVVFGSTPDQLHMHTRTPEQLQINNTQRKVLEQNS